MNTTIINTQNPLLKDFIQSYIFFRTSGKQHVAYTTFPNTNLCLALYKNNQIDYLRDAYHNVCNIGHSPKYFQSHLYAFHQRPFEVNIGAAVDQVCILFHPGGLRAFSGEDYQTILESDMAFEVVFPNSDGFLARLFNEEDLSKRILLIEYLLISRIKRKLKLKVQESLYLIGKMNDGQLKVDQLARKMNMDSSTLYRLFHAELGLSPKTFLQTHRFRTALKHLMSTRYTNLNEVANANDYYDLAHFTKDIKILAGRPPKSLKKEISVEQKQLAWIYRNKYQ